MSTTSGGKLNRRKVYELTNGRCAYCGRPLDYNDFHVDHIIPKKRGGATYSYKNLFASCPECNLFKRDMTLEEFRTNLARLPYTNKKTMLFFNHIANKFMSISDLEDFEVEFYFEKLGLKEGDLIGRTKNVCEIYSDV